MSVSPENDIIVKRANQKLNITIPDYPAQVANVGDRVGFSIEFNGLPSDIRRDFGDGKILTCNTRQECGTGYSQRQSRHQVQRRVRLFQLRDQRGFPA